MELTADQQAQANSLNNAVAWVYPDMSNTDFWNQYFNQTPTLTPEEQSSGISIGPADSDYYTQALREPSVLPGVTDTQRTNPPSSPIPATGNNWIGSGSAPVGGTSGTGQWLYGGPEGDYQSSLIKSLRENFTSAPQAPGVSLRANKENGPGIEFGSIGSGGLNSPGGLAMNPSVLSPTDVRSYLPYVIDNVNEYLGNQTSEDLVKAAYGNIGRTGIGSNQNQIDQEGYDYWTNQLNSGALDPVEFQQAFANSVNTVLNEQPDAGVSQYVDSYLSNQSADQLVRDAYADIGRNQVGATPTTIDQEGYDYWTSQLESGALTPEEFLVAFSNSVDDVLGGYGGAPIVVGPTPSVLPDSYENDGI